MFKRRRNAVLVSFALAAVGVFAFTSSASAVTYTNACRNTAQTANWDQVNVTLTGTSSPAVTTPGGSVALSNINQTLAVPGAIFVAGYNLGLLTTGVNNIPTDFTSVIDAANTTQLSQTTNTVSQTLSTTITDPDGVPGSGDETGTDASATVTFADETWTAGASGTIGFHEHNDPAVTPTAGGGIRTNSSLAGGLIHVQFRCTSGTVAGMNPGVPTFTDAPIFASTYIDSGVPVTNAGPDQTVLAGSVVTLDGSASNDSDLPNDTLSYQWTQTSGPAVTLSDPTAVMPTFTTLTPGPDTYTFDLTVTDQVGQSSTDSVTITTTPVVVDNFPPVANAGPDQLNVAAGTLVTLDGSGSTDGDLPNDTLTYLWTQTAGPAVTLSDPTAVMPTFTMPGADVTFQLTVTDQAGKTSTDSVTITAFVVQPMVDKAGQVIVNGPVKAGATAKTYVLKVTNLGTTTNTVDCATEITAAVLVNGTANGSVSCLTASKTISPGGSARFRLRWSGDPLPAGATVEFTACVNEAGDIDTSNDCGSVTRTT